MHSHLMDDFRHSHVFLGEAHDRNERKTWGSRGFLGSEPNCGPGEIRTQKG